MTLARPGSPNGRPYEPPDQAVRARISSDLTSTLLVEAGAGSGKTTSLVDRMVSLVRSGHCTVDRIAAVTFTRKAAAELRERFQVELEATLASLAPDDPERPLLEDAIRDLDGAFLGTIHSFCAKLLRERPLEAGLDPGFREVLEAEADRMRRRAWLEFLERLGTEGDEDLRELDRLGIAPDHLEDAFAKLVENPDVDFSGEPTPPPDEEEIAAVDEAFGRLIDRAFELMGDRSPQRGWDRPAKRLRTLRYWRRTLAWRTPAVFFDALATVVRRSFKLTQYKWAEPPHTKGDVKAFEASLNEFAKADGRADRLLRQWWAHRYPVAVRVARRGAEAFARQRKERGELDFQDLLVLSADLLRRDASARRDLGARYSRILVDEFQDTDPLQAEILMLLASDPSQGDDWTKVVPRPGALFVVGDPKQSIYRFRRADIALYDSVKRRFREFGDILKLEANFRSLRAFEHLVEGVFDRGDRFGTRDTDRQASFAPLLTQPLPGREGPGLLAAYRVEGPARGNQRPRDDAARIASMIARRVAAGERECGDFMVLTRTRKHLDLYARAMEDHNLPVDVSGAGVGFEDELAALFLIFRCLADPAHQVRVVGALTGPLFGVTLDLLVAYRDGLGSSRDRKRCFRINRKPLGEGEVAEALAALHRWWKRAQREPADVTLERIVAETGLFPLAAAETLGQLRAGALTYLMDAVRARALEGDASLAGAVDAMETAMAWNDAEAPLVPQRPNCVQVMNLHRAKGLEANVVFLAAGFGDAARPPTMRVSRDENGRARGTIPITIKGRYQTAVIAAPATWEKDKEIEAEFEEAERVRLLYVAATRARDELWVARGPVTKSGARAKNPSPWRWLEDWIDEEAAAAGPDDERFARSAEIERVDAPTPDPLPPDVDLEEPIRAAARRVERLRAPTYRLETVTARAKRTGTVAETSKAHTRVFERPVLAPSAGGYEWGSVVHAVLAQAGQGTSGEELERFARSLLVEFERPVDDRGAPVELESVLALVAAARRSEIWARAMESPERHTEVPFAASLAGDGESAAPDVVEGVVDLVFREGDGWVVADYKTDSGEDPDFRERAPLYRAQVDLYAECWERLTGDPVRERVLVFTSQGRSESW